MSFAVMEAHDRQRLEKKLRCSSKLLTVFKFFEKFERSDSAPGDARIAGFFRHPQCPLDAAGLALGDRAGRLLHFWIIKAVH